jgi:zinc finger SWIM domain-containing protein 3
MLVQASEVYTPIIFEAFQGEYERSMAACSRLLDENRYAIAVGSFYGASSFEKERIVISDPLNKTATCSCQMFNRTGILCAHGLKVLDLMNIKTLPSHYILKRWTREARNGRVQDKEGRNVVANPKLEAQLRTRKLFHKFLNLAYKASDYPDCCLLLEDGLDCLSTQLEDKLNLSTNVLSESCNDQENVEPNKQQNDAENVELNTQQKDDFLAAQLKKKEVKPKKLRRNKNWFDKLPKGNPKMPTKSAETKKSTKSAGSKKNQPKVCSQLEI